MLSRWWEQQGLLPCRARSRPRSRSRIVIPPPNVTGALHLGHALNNTLQDILIRMKRMQGFNTLWMPGTDHAGIATQAVVERRLKEEENLTRHDLGREKLVERIWEWKDEYESPHPRPAEADGLQLRLAADAVHAGRRSAPRRAQTFFDLFREGLIYRGKRLVNWDTFLQTAVSDDEVFHEEVKGHFWHFRYPVIDPQPGEPTHVTIATTRPETMLGDTAVAVHPDPAAALDSAEAELLRRSCQGAGQGTRRHPSSNSTTSASGARRMLPQLDQLRDMAAPAASCCCRWSNREIPLVADDWAKPELGSGCVKITPAHDPNDYDVGKRQDLPMINILNPDGTLNANAGKYQGLTDPGGPQAGRRRPGSSWAARGDVEDRADRPGALRPQQDADRAVPGRPVVRRRWSSWPSRRWTPSRTAACKIFPERYAKGYLDWLGEKRDWPVSRQLWWGHQIPVWSKSVQDQAECDQLVSAIRPLCDRHPDLAVLWIEADEALAAAKARGGEEYERLAENARRDAARVLAGGSRPTWSARWKRWAANAVHDVLDTWFSSALWPHSTLGWPETTPELEYFYPTSVLITSRDIITLWVARMVLMGLNNMGEVPFREVFIHPKILDGYGETMSKSKGNGVDPLDVIDKFGPDALRFGMAYLTHRNAGRADAGAVRVPALRRR